MRNVLQKQPEMDYIPAVPGRAGRPAYCETKTVYKTTGGGGSYQPMYPGGLENGQNIGVSGPHVYDEQGRPLIFVGGSSHTYAINETVCYPAVPTIQAIPAKANYYANNGWNGGARSIAAVPPNGYAEVHIPPTPAGILVGLTQGEFTHAYSESAFALVARGTGVTVMVGGVEQGLEGAPGSLLRFERSNGRVRMLVDDVVVREDTDHLTKPVYMSALLYSLADYAYDPVIGALHTLQGVASTGVRAMFRIDPRGTAHVGLKVVGLASLNGAFLTRGIAQAGVTAFGTGVVAHNAAGVSLIGVGAVADGYGMFGDFPPVVSGLSSYCHGSMGIDLYATNALNTSTVNGSYGGYQLEARAGRPEAVITQMIGHLAPMLLTALAQAGTSGRVDGSTHMDGKASDAPLSVMDSTAALRYSLTSFEAYWPEGVVDAADRVLALDSMGISAAVLFAMHEGFEIGDTLDLFLLIDLAMYEMLGLDTTLTLGGVIEMIMRERLSLADSADRAKAETLQYAVNAVTGALSRYSGFGFKQFATSVGGDTYAIKDDGLYHLRGGSDDGEALSAMIDFGASDYGTAQGKRLSSVFAGIATDGVVYIRVTDDGGEERIYRTTDGDNEVRAMTAKGLAARHWRVRLELCDATYADLDNLEVEIGVSQRRLRR